jgi:hypothetical protein
MMGMGRAMTRTPQMQQAMPTILPTKVEGYMSPYPTVVIVMAAHQNVSGIEMNCVAIGPNFSLFQEEKNIAKLLVWLESRGVLSRVLSAQTFNVFFTVRIYLLSTVRKISIRIRLGYFLSILQT